MQETTQESPPDEDTVVEDQDVSIGRLTIEDFLPNGSSPDELPLPDGESVGIDPRALVRASVASRVPLPTAPVDEDYLGSDPAKRTDEAIAASAKGLLYATPMVGSIRGVCIPLRKACKALKLFHESQRDRLVARRDSRPRRIPDPSLGKYQRFFRIDALQSLSSYAGLGLGFAATAVTSFLGIEIAFETGALKASDFKFAQEAFGAFGLVWGLSVGAIVLTRFRLWFLEKYYPVEAVAFLGRFTKIGFDLVWFGLPVLGTLLGLLQTIEKPKESWLACSLIFALMAIGVPIIARSCVAIEKALEAALASVIDKSRIDNPLIDEDQAQIDSVERLLMVVDACCTLAKEPLKRLKKHLKKESEDWIAYRDRLLRDEAARNAADIDEDKIIEIEKALLEAKQKSRRSADRLDRFVNRT